MATLRKKVISDAFKAHSTSIQSKTASKVALASRIASVLHLSVPVNTSKKLSELGQGDLEPWDYALALMRYPPFRRDRLVIQEADARVCVTIGDIAGLVFQWYIDDGWTIT